MSIKYNIHKNILGEAESICINTVIDGEFHGKGTVTLKNGKKIN